MWASWAFCELVHMSTVTPHLSIKWHGVNLRVRAFWFSGIGFFCIFVDDHGTTTAGADVHLIGRFVLQRLVGSLAVVEHTGEPHLGSDVYVGTGAKLLGSIRVGSGVVIGANAVVIGDVPDQHVAVGIPARCLPRRTERAEP